MKTIVYILLLMPMISYASNSSVNASISVITPIEDDKVILKQDGISVTAQDFTLDGATYATLSFTNTTSKAIRILWSAQVNGLQVSVNMDGTTQAYLMIPAGETIIFGHPNSQDPLIEVPSRDFQKNLTVNIEIH